MTLNVMQAVGWLVKSATGGEYGDGDRVAGYGQGYADGHYGGVDDQTAVWVTGNWNPKRYPREGEPPLTPEENVGPLLAAALERVGAEVEWLDEWTECAECYRLTRTEADSYSWRPANAWVEDVGTVCADCLVKYGEDALPPYLNDPRMAVTWCDGAHLESLGFVQWEESNPHTYESGWYGTEDDPKAITASIRREYPDADIIFLLDASEQFRIEFSAYVRTEKPE
jgi:hypothetical protein